MARPERFELPTYSSGGCRSIQLSYGRVVQVYMGCEHAINLRRSGLSSRATGRDQAQTRDSMGGFRLPPSSATLRATTTGAFGFGARFVYIDRASPKLSAIEPRDSLLAFFVIRHFDETEASRPACLAISQNARTLHMSIRLEKLAQLVFGRVEAEIANEDVFQVASFFRLANQAETLRKTDGAFTRVRKRAESIANPGTWASGRLVVLSAPGRGEAQEGLPPAPAILPPAWLQYLT
jgi:hypothetical protein